MTDEPPPRKRLPIRAHYEPPIQGPHEVVGEEGITRHDVYAGPNAQAPPACATETPVSDAELDAIAAATPGRPRWQRITLRALDWLALPLSILAGALLALAWGSLNDRARLVTAALAIVVGTAHWAIRRAKRRRVED